MKNNQTAVRARFMGLTPSPIVGTYAHFIPTSGKDGRHIRVEGDTRALTALPVGTEVDVVYGRRYFGDAREFIGIETPKTVVYSNHRNYPTSC